MPAYCSLAVIDEIGRDRIQSKLALLLGGAVAVVAVLFENRLDLCDIVRF